MIVFFDTSTGEITGTISGRVHREEELRMSVGDPDKVDKIVVQWKPINFVYNKALKMKVAQDFIPDTEQEDLFKQFDSGEKNVYDYKVDLKSKKLIAK